MGKATGFLEFERKDNKKEEPLKRLEHWDEFDTNLPEAERREQASRCMDCGIPFCQSGIMLNGMVTGCPINNLIPEWNHLIYLGKWKQGLERLLKTNNFPEFTGRVCPAPCEHGCTVGLNDKAVTIKANERYLIEKAFEEEVIKAEPPKIRTDKKVAIIGSGPSGLAAADFLNRLGHNVTVYEREDKIGGLLMYGIPNMKLNKNIVDRRVNLLKEEGIIFKTKINVCRDITVKELEDVYDAIIIATGASKARDLNVTGRELKGIHLAVDFLTNNTKELINSTFNKGYKISAKDKNVIVIGGGDTGTDCVGTSLRQGAVSVTQFEIMDEPLKERGVNNPWPQYARVLKVDYGQEEYIEKHGVDPRVYCTTVKSFKGNDGIVKSVVTVQVSWEKDNNGRVYPKEIPGSEKEWAADLVLLAMGFTGVEEYIKDSFNIDGDERGNIKADNCFRTSKEKVFAIGDARRGPSLVVWAIEEGRRGALAVEEYLNSR